MCAATRPAGAPALADRVPRHGVAPAGEAGS
jgi:hypothetical protein